MNAQDINYLINNGLENDRVKLSVINKIDQCNELEQIAYSEVDMMKYSPSSISTPVTFNQYFSNAIRGLEKGEVVAFIVYDKLNAAYAGSTRFANISIKDQRVEIGWTWLGKEFQRTGLNRHNKYLMLQFAFERADCQRVELKADGHNIQSRQAMEGIGATFEGALRSHTLMPDGRRRDTVYYSILRDEWPRIKTTIFSSIS